jgi:DNA-binding transcriptional MerR regulator
MEEFMKQEHYLLNEVARLVGCKGYQIAYLISNGKVEEPKLRINNKRVFTPEDVTRIREVFKAKKPRKVANAK